MLDAISIDSKDQPQFQIRNNLDLLKDLSRVNVFVGKNNSGKSRLLRTIFQGQSGISYYESIPKKNKDWDEILRYLHSSINQNFVVARRTQIQFDRKSEFENYLKKLLGAKVPEIGLLLEVALKLSC